MEKQTPEPVPPAPSKRREIVGWTAVIISTSLASLWAFWGAIENFHEGWYSESLIENIGVMILQYALMMMVFVILTVVSLRWPRIGGTLHAAAGVYLAAFLFGRGAGLYFVGVPLVVLGLLYWYGRAYPLRRAYRIAVGVPLLIYVGFSVEPAIRVSGRFDDGNRGARIVEGNGVRLKWAPEGPGWPRRGIHYGEAQRICRYLKTDGESLSNTAQDIWRLPTIDEVVRSMTRRGTNCGGAWDSVNGSATYTTTPEKESPLWDPHSPIIYWWTSTEIDSGTVYRVIYHGGVNRMKKEWGLGSLGFRAVREPER